MRSVVAVFAVALLPGVELGCAIVGIPLPTEQGLHGTPPPGDPSPEAAVVTTQPTVSLADATGKNRFGSLVRSPHQSGNPRPGQKKEPPDVDEASHIVAAPGLFLLGQRS